MKRSFLALNMGRSERNLPSAKDASHALQLPAALRQLLASDSARSGEYHGRSAQQKITGVHRVPPRFLRLRDAPAYLGMDKNRFNHDVRPCVTTIPIGTHGIAFDRLELDAWAEDYVQRNERPAANPQRRKPWDRNKYQDSPSVVGSG